MKTAHDVLIEKFDAAHPMDSPYFSGFDGVYDGRAEFILQAMKECAEQYARLAFESVADEAHPCEGTYETFDDFKNNHPLQ